MQKHGISSALLKTPHKLFLWHIWHLISQFYMSLCSMEEIKEKKCDKWCVRDFYFIVMPIALEPRFHTQALVVYLLILCTNVGSKLFFFWLLLLVIIIILLFCSCCAKQWWRWFGCVFEGEWEAFHFQGKLNLYVLTNIYIYVCGFEWNHSLGPSASYICSKQNEPSLLQNGLRKWQSPQNLDENNNNDSTS